MRGLLALSIFLNLVLLGPKVDWTKPETAPVWWFVLLTIAFLVLLIANIVKAFSPKRDN